MPRRRPAGGVMVVRPNPDGWLKDDKGALRTHPPSAPDRGAFM
ncbi:hypothetical protein SXCC_02257 [Gluconacetobacter sp. SXCC-1]|nr:hypothetical protein SXCC_02257 [Gluconacetobacter sp. SXCC-1]